MRSIFLDTHYLIAIINPFEQWHEPAHRVSSELRDLGLIVTDSVFTETLNYFAEYSPQAKLHAALTVEDFAANPNVKVVSQDPKLFLEGLKLYKSRLDKGYSLTDCISMNVCREYGIDEILSNDHHFVQEGFSVLF